MVQGQHHRYLTKMEAVAPFSASMWLSLLLCPADTAVWYSYPSGRLALTCLEGGKVLQCFDDSDESKLLISYSLHGVGQVFFQSGRPWCERFAFGSVPLL
jgi:hypothetical protein